MEIDNWAEINYDLLNEIVQYIECHGDYVRFRSVCKNWYLELPEFSKHLQLPWLLLPFDDESNTLRPFYHIEDGKVVHHLELPETKNIMFRGSCFGWLITVGLDGTIQMLEPFTRAHINLPPLSTFPDIANYQPDRLGEEYTIRDRDRPYGTTYNGSTYHLDSIHMQKGYVTKIVISCAPDDTDQDFMAVAIYGEFGNLCYCRRDDKTWFHLPMQNSVYHDVIFYEGKVYGANYLGHICEYDMRTMEKNIGRIPQHISHEYCCPRYLVVIDGDLLLVTRHISYMDSIEGRIYRTTEFHVYKLESKEGDEPRWLEMKSLGNYMLVLGFNYSTSLLPHPISSNEGNCIYYSDDYTEGQYLQDKGGHDNGVFELENQTTHLFFPNSNLICPAPIWLFSI